MCVFRKKVQVLDPLADVNSLGYEVSCGVHGRIVKSLDETVPSNLIGWVTYGDQRCKVDSWHYESLPNDFYVRIVPDLGPSLPAPHPVRAVDFSGAKINLSAGSYYEVRVRKTGTTNFVTLGFMSQDTALWYLLADTALSGKVYVVSVGDVLQFGVTSVSTGPSVLNPTVLSP